MRSSPARTGATAASPRSSRACSIASARVRRASSGWSCLGSCVRRSRKRPHRVRRRQATPVLLPRRGRGRSTRRAAGPSGRGRRCVQRRCALRAVDQPPGPHRHRRRRINLQRRTHPYEEAYEEGFEDMERRVPDISKIQALTGLTDSRARSDRRRRCPERAVRPFERDGRAGAVTEPSQPDDVRMPAARHAARVDHQWCMADDSAKSTDECAVSTTTTSCAARRSG